VARTRRRWRLTTAVSLLYVAFLVVWQGLRFTPVGRWWPFELVDIFGLLLFAPLPLLLLVSLVAANRRAGLWLLLPLLVLAWEYGPLFLPRTMPRVFAPSAATQGRPLRVMTANLLVSNQSVTTFGALLRVEQPDIVAMQELSHAMGEHLAATINDQYPYQLLGPSDAPDGLGILSRYPLHVESETGWYGHVCGCQRVSVDVEGRPITFLNVHPWPPHVGFARLGRLPIPASFDANQTREMLEAALDGIDASQGPLLMLGDFNVSDRQPTYRWLRRELRDAYREAGWGLGYTFPALSFEGAPDLAIIRIDYVLHDPSVRARAVHTGTTPGSDHHYVVADLLLP
jgi:endonuclease/exonuclease/phosphatase (EEP) superfamily protein YafD